ncbi:MAG: hypothetical protein IJV19_02415 [Prevotella sp.]|nr:hypothetical protein [Prevotella sp.]
MKKFCFVMIGVALTFVVGCGNKTQKSESEVTDSTGVDSTTISVEEQPQAESDNQIGSVGDLVIFDLKGKVQKCVWKNGNGTNTYVFDEQGKWIGQNGQRLEDVFAGGIKRDKNGRLTDTEMDGYGSIHYAYNADGKPTNIDEDGFSRKLIYDTDGNVAKEIQELAPEMGDDEGEPEITTLKFTYLEKDEVGNWIKRKSSKGTETRTITYFK